MRYPSLFLLTFRSERLDADRPALREAIAASSAILSGIVMEGRGEQPEARLTLPQAAGIVSAWSLVHGCCCSTDGCSRCSAVSRKGPRRMR